MKKYLLPLILCLLLNPLRGYPVEFDATVMDWDSGLAVSFEQPFAGIPGGAYSFIRISATNPTSRDILWTPWFKDRSLYNNGRTYQRRLDIAVPAGATVVEDVVLGGSISSNNLIEVGEHLLNPAVGSVKPSMDLAITTTSLSAITGEFNDLLFTIGLDPSSFPRKALALASINTVHLRDDDWTQLDKAQQQALLDWVSWGGHLLFWIEAQAGLPAWLSDLQAGYAFTGGRIGVSGHTAFTPEAFIGPKLTWYGGWEFRWDKGSRSVLLEERRPGWELFVWLLVFGASGVVIIFLASRKNPLRTLWLMPVVAFVVCLFIGVRFLLLDGLGSTGAIASIHIAQPDGRMTVINKILVRSGILLSDSVIVPEGVLQSLPAEDQLLDPYSVLRSDSHTVEGDRYSGFLKNRRVSYLIQTGFAPAVAEVEMIAGPGPVVVSSIPAVLVEFVFLDRNGQRWFAESVHPGEQVVLTKLDTAAQPLRKLGSEVIQELQPGGFAAFATGASPFLQPPTGIDWIGQEQLYIGAIRMKP